MGAEEEQSQWTGDAGGSSAGELRTDGSGARVTFGAFGLGSFWRYPDRRSRPGQASWQLHTRGFKWQATVATGHRASAVECDGWPWLAAAWTARESFLASARRGMSRTGRLKWPGPPSIPAQPADANQLPRQYFLAFAPPSRRAEPPLCRACCREAVYPEALFSVSYARFMCKALARMDRRRG